MLIETLKTIFDRDLKKLKTEIELYPNEAMLWSIQKNITNSAGNLCLHLIGNLNTYIGKVIGGTGYTRHREQEFSLKDIPRAYLLQKIDEIGVIVSSSLDKLTPEDLLKEYPVLVFEKATTTEYLLIHLTTHLSYHLGQINYHRRLLNE